MDLDVFRLLAVQYFAALRPAEASRMSDADILPEFVPVLGVPAKTRQPHDFENAEGQEG